MSDDESVPSVPQKLSKDPSRIFRKLDQGGKEALRQAKAVVLSANKIIRKRFPVRQGSLQEMDVDNGQSLDPEEFFKGMGPVEDIYEVLQEIWTENMDNTPVFKDVPRLVRRCKVHGISDKHVLFDAAARALPSGAIENAKLICELFNAIAEKIESDEVVDKVHKATEEALPKVDDENADLSIWTKALCHEIGLDSKTMKVIKCIHQNIVLQSTIKLKLMVTQSLMTRDIKTEEGWQILIVLADYIQVKHIRREQSVDPPGGVHNHWEFQWEVALSFDKQMNELTQTQLRITELGLSETMDKELAEKLTAKFMDGDLIVM